MNKLIVEFCIFSKNIHYDEITSILWLHYDEYCEKWWKMNDNKVWAINNEFIWVKNSWISKSEEDLEIHMKIFINIFSKYKEKLIKLKKLWCKFQLSIIYYYYWNNPWLHINSDWLNIFSDLWIDIDFDIYSLWNENK